MGFSCYRKLRIKNCRGNLNYPSPPGRTAVRHSMIAIALLLNLGSFPHEMRGILYGRVIKTDVRSHRLCPERLHQEQNLLGNLFLSLDYFFWENNQLSNLGSA